MRQTPGVVSHCFALKGHDTTMKQEDGLFQGPPIQLFFFCKVMPGGGQVDNLVLVADSQFQVLVSKACGVPDLIVQHENSFASWRAGERGRERCYLGSRSSFPFLESGLSSAFTASGPVLWLAARCSPVREDAGKPSCLDLTIPRLK